MRVGGGTPEGANDAAEQLVKQGVSALVSFGFAGALDPAMRAGSVIVPGSILFEGTRYAANHTLAERFGGLTAHCLVAGTAIAADVASKRRLRATTQADAIDLESGGLARVARAHGLPFVAVRAISDTADQDLPPAALLALDEQGHINLGKVLISLLRQPNQLVPLMRLAANASSARRALIGLTRSSPTARH